MVRIKSNHFLENNADAAGGAIFSHGCKVWLTNVDVEKNKAARGGGIAAEIIGELARLRLQSRRRAERCARCN